MKGTHSLSESCQSMPSKHLVLLSLSSAAFWVGCASAPPPPSPATSATSPAVAPVIAAAPTQTGNSEGGKPTETRAEQNSAAHSQPAANLGAGTQAIPVTATHSGGGSGVKPAAPTEAASSGPDSGKMRPAQDSEMAMMRIEMMALKEKMATLQRKMELVLKAQRSGLYESDTPDLVRSAVQNAEPRKNVVPPLGSAGPIDRFDAELDQTPREKSLTPESPKLIVDRAVALLAQGDYARVAQSLENFQQRFPNNPLSNTAELTLAEAYVEMKNPQLALPHLRTFYLQHPNDTQMYRAKWLEARVEEQMQAPQKAAQLFREVIALAPQSDLALRSRAALEKLNRGPVQ